MDTLDLNFKFLINRERTIAQIDVPKVSRQEPAIAKAQRRFTFANLSLALFSKPLITELAQDARATADLIRGYVIDATSGESSWPRAIGEHVQTRPRQPAQSLGRIDKLVVRFAEPDGKLETSPVISTVCPCRSRSWS